MCGRVRIDERKCMEVRAEQITKDYFRKHGDGNVFTAVDACDFLLPAGLLTVVRGKSGSGKSTLLNMLSGNLTPTAGHVFYDDADLYSMKDDELSRFRNNNIGYIPQGRSAVWSLTVLENVMLPLMLYGARDEKRAVELLERFNISDLKDEKISRLSGGELRRLSIARALIKDPEVIFADEPTGDLDDVNTGIVFEELRGIARSGAAVLVVTHEEDAAAYADRMLNMEGGVISAEDGTTASQ